ncbi:MAG: hypothetical protein M3O61_03060 [Gemmatimonadota bacterium]|nr:hypothetical protein [Gemmatimonadota bacterium]
MEAFEAGSGYEYRAALAAGGHGATILVRGNVASGVVARIRIPDRNQLTAYTVQVTQVAAKATYEQRSVSGYSAVLLK